jgi:type IV secretion system protein VirB6
VTGESDTQASDLIEENLVLMQLALSSIDTVNISEQGSLALSEQKTRALWMVGLGAAGPPVVAGVMLLMYQVAMALFIGLGPLFVLTLMFEQTKQMFWKWLYYGIGTLFSMAVLALMTSLALKVVGLVTASFWLTSALSGGELNEGMSSRALQQGGIGLMLTMLLISVPPIASNFFQGALGSAPFQSAFGGGRSGGIDGRGTSLSNPGSMRNPQERETPNSFNGSIGGGITSARSTQSLLPSSYDQEAVKLPSLRNREVGPPT